MKYFDYESIIEIENVALNVFDLQKQTLFYKEVVGLQVIKENEYEVELGVGFKTLLKLVKISDNVRKKESGLYHTAFLLPTREDLGDAFYHLLKIEQPLHGASDHGYSEAIYLEDAEGNGIEIYRDKDRKEWKRDERGLPVGQTIAMDYKAVFALGKEKDKYVIPSGTKVGHVHLKVFDEVRTTRLYQDILPMYDKLTVPTVSFIAGGDYHHHLAFNVWEKGLKRKEKDTLGLRYITMNLSDEKTYLEILNSTDDRIVVEDKKDYIIVEDLLNGIVVHLRLDK